MYLKEWVDSRIRCPPWLYILNLHRPSLLPSLAISWKTWSTAGRLSIILHHAKWLHAHFLIPIFWNSLGWPIYIFCWTSSHSLWVYEPYMKVYGFSNELKNMLPQELNCINCNQTMCIVENPYFATAFLCAATACFTPGCNSADHCKSSLSVMLRLNYQRFENVKNSPL